MIGQEQDHPLNDRTDASSASGNTVESFQVQLNRTHVEHLKEAGLRASHAHAAFLEMRREALQQIALVNQMRLRIGAAGKTVLFPYSALVEFATGSMARCFGPEFDRYEGRRYPRIPNGDLLLMSRVLSIEGSRREIYKGASITTEYDVPVDAWYYSPRSKNLPPYAILMEISLQPCGFLSAFMGTSFLLPDGDFYFRNLDGRANVLAELDLRGKTVTNRSRLLSTTVHGKTVIQKYEFSLSCSGQDFYRGESVFGYFSYETMVNQIGLDGNRGVPPGQLPGRTSRSQPRGQQGTSEDSPVHGALMPQLDLLDRWSIDLHGGSRGMGVVRAEAAIQPQDWFYSCHFYQDPVMPGSLGIEAMLQAMLLLAIEDYPSQPVMIAHRVDQPVTWKYRGQVLPANRLMALEVNITHKETRDGTLTLSGDGSLWIDGIRIYEVHGLGLTVHTA